MKYYNETGNEIEITGAGAILNAHDNDGNAGRLYLVEICSAYGARIYMDILPNIPRPFRVYYSGGDLPQFRRAYKTPGGAARYIQKIAETWGADIKTRVYITGDEINEILRLPWWEFDYNDAETIE